MVHLTGHSAREIAENIGVDESTIRHHLENTLKPMWRDWMEVLIAV